MRNKTINELTSLENPRLTDTLPIWDGTEGKTKKVSLAKIPANVITPVDSLPESPNILDRVYRYNNKYYVGNESAQTLTELAPKADIPTVVDTVEDGNMNPVTSNAVYDAIAPIGTSITANPYPLPVTIPANGKASIGEITLTLGSWIVIASGWNFVDTPEDILYVCLNSDWFMSSKPSNGWEVVGYYKTNANTVVKVNAYNSTGSAMAVTSRNWRITAVRLA